MTYYRGYCFRLIFFHTVKTNGASHGVCANVYLFGNKQSWQCSACPFSIAMSLIWQILRSCSMCYYIFKNVCLIAFSLSEISLNKTLWNVYSDLLTRFCRGIIENLKVRENSILRSFLWNFAKSPHLRPTYAKFNESL